MSPHPPERAPIYSIEAQGNDYIEDMLRYRFACGFVFGKRVLDVGCGTGYGAWLMREEGGAEIVLGLDRFTQSLSTEDGTVQFAAGRVEQLPVADRQFDVAVSMETVEHLQDPLPYLWEMRRVLREGGLVIVSTPLNNREDRMRPANPHHIREYSQEEFAALMTEVFDEVSFWSQVTSYNDDLAMVQTPVVNSGVRRLVKSVVPPVLIRSLRRAVGSRGLRPTGSQIVAGVDLRAGVQLAVCVKRGE